MTAPVADEPPLASEELLLGPRSGRERPRWLPVAVLAVALLIAITVLVWRGWPRPAEPLSLAELEDTYAGMVRSDGTNDASVLSRQAMGEIPMSVTPAECSPLVQTTVANRFPDTAVDGVGTYWIGRDSTISLFTLRFPDAGAAETERARIEAALLACTDRQVVLRTGAESSVRTWQANVARTDETTAAEGAIGYTLTGPDGLLALQVMPYLNTLSWQYRYETGAAAYSPIAADQLMQSLHLQLDAVVAARPG